VLLVKLSFDAPLLQSGVKGATRTFKPRFARPAVEVPRRDPNTIDREVPIQPVRRSDAGYDVSRDASRAQGGALSGIRTPA